MNERIKQLLLEAKIYDGSATQDIITCPEDLEKFAELIVQEALSKIDDVGYKASNNISTDDTELFKSVLKRHFGVEE